LLNNIYRAPVSDVFRRKDSGFAVCDENLASVSQFVARIRHGRSFKQGHDEDRRVPFGCSRQSARLDAASSSHQLGSVDSGQPEK
jgi:hypothetical protein